MGVIVRPVNIATASIFGGWNSAFANQLIASAGKNNIQAVSDTTLRRYAGIRFPGVSVNVLESSTKAAPTVWSVPAVLPVAALGILDIFALPNVSPDTLLVATTTAADGRLWRFILGTGWTSMAFPESGTSDAVNSISPTSDPDLFLIGNQARSTAGAPSLWTFQLSTLTWTKVAGSAIPGTWTYTQNNGSVNALFRNGVAIATAGNGTANGFQVWRSDSTFTVWTKIGGDSVFGSWAAANKRNGKCVFGSSNGKLFCGIGGAAGNAEAWECDNPFGAVPAWTKIGDSTQWTSGTISNASEVAALGNKIVFGTSGSVAGDSQTWQWDIASRTWTQLAIGTWSRTNSGALYVSPYDNSLFAGVGNNSTGTAILFQVPGGFFSNGGRRGYSYNPYPVRISL